jgi:NAD(P)-dependent dehydrogenase (short-subunit alcohol dehydrogenase family)
MSQELRYDGEVAVVTGAGRGLGRAYALLLAARGARVVVNDLGGDMHGSGADGSVAQAVADEIVSAGGTAVAVSSSVATPAGGEEIVAAALDAFGELHIVVNSVGVLRPASFADTTLSDLDIEHSVHVGGTFNVCHAAWPHLRGQSYGRIVTTGSASFLGTPWLTSYSTAKGGVFSLMRSMALDGYSVGIKVNQINPVSDGTRMSDFRFTHRQTMLNAPKSERVRKQVVTPPHLIAPAVAVLCHQACPTTGEVYGARGNHVHRFFVAETQGYENVDQTPESLLSHWADVTDETAYTQTPVGSGRSTPDVIPTEAVHR